MNILIATENECNPKLGGIERVSVTLANQLKKHGYGVYFITLAKNPHTDSEPYTLVAEQIILPNKGDVCCDDNIQCFSNFVKDKKIDVILNQGGEAPDFSSLCIKVKEKTGVKLLSKIHLDPAQAIKSYQADQSLLEVRSVFLRQIKHFLKQKFPFKLKRMMKEYSAFYNQLYRGSDSVILLSEHFKPAFKVMTGLVNLSKLEAIPNPLSFQTPKETYQKEKLIVWVGRFDKWQKRPERLVQIWSYLEDKHPDWNVSFLGDGATKPQVEELVRELGLKNIRFEGFADPVSAYQKSSIICMTSTYEGFGLILTEAMQFGAVPMAFSSYESVYDIINDGATGYIIQPYDLKMYAHRLESLMVDEDRRKIMSLNAMKYVTDKFDIDKITKQWIALFDKYVVK